MPPYLPLKRPGVLKVRIRRQKPVALWNDEEDIKLGHGLGAVLKRLPLRPTLLPWIRSPEVNEEPMPTSENPLPPPHSPGIINYEAGPDIGALSGCWPGGQSQLGHGELIVIRLQFIRLIIKRKERHLFRGLALFKFQLQGSSVNSFKALAEDQCCGA